MSEEYTPQLLTSEDVFTVQFPATKFRDGYDQNQIDDYLDEVVRVLSYYEALSAAPEAEVDLTYITVRGVDVREVDFDYTRMRVGYDQDAVDDYLDQVAATLEAYENAYGIPPSDQRYQVLQVDGPALEAEAAQQAAAAGELPAEVSAPVALGDSAAGGAPVTAGNMLSLGASVGGAVPLDAAPSAADKAASLGASETAPNSPGYSSVLGTPPARQPGVGEFNEAPQYPGDSLDWMQAPGQSPASSPQNYPDYPPLYPQPDADSTTFGASSGYGFSPVAPGEYASDYNDEEGEYADYNGGNPNQDESAAIPAETTAPSGQANQGGAIPGYGFPAGSPTESMAADTPDVDLTEDDGETEAELPGEIGLIETEEATGFDDFGETPAAEMAPHEDAFPPPTDTPTPNPYPMESGGYGNAPDPGFEAYGQPEAWGNDGSAADTTPGGYPEVPRDPNFAYGYAQPGAPAGDYGYQEQDGVYAENSGETNWEAMPQPGNDTPMPQGNNPYDAPGSAQFEAAGYGDAYANEAATGYEANFGEDGYTETEMAAAGGETNGETYNPSEAGQYPEYADYPETPGTNPDVSEFAVETPFAPTDMSNGYQQYDAYPEQVSPENGGTGEFAAGFGGGEGYSDATGYNDDNAYPTETAAGMGDAGGGDFEATGYPETNAEFTEDTGGFATPGWGTETYPGVEPDTLAAGSDAVGGADGLDSPAGGTTPTAAVPATTPAFNLPGEAPAVPPVDTPVEPIRNPFTPATGNAAGAVESSGIATPPHEPLTEVVTPDLPTPGVGLDLSSLKTTDSKTEPYSAGEAPSGQAPHEPGETNATGKFSAAALEALDQARNDPDLGKASLTNSVAAANQVASTASPNHKRFAEVTSRATETAAETATVENGRPDATQPPKNLARNRGDKPGGGDTVTTAYPAGLAGIPGLEPLNPAELLTPATGIETVTGPTFTEVPIDHEAASRLAETTDIDTADETASTPRETEEPSTPKEIPEPIPEETETSTFSGTKLPENANPRPLLQGEEPFGEVTEEGRFVPHFLAGYRTNLDTFTSAYGSLEEHSQPHAKKPESIAKLEAEQPRKSITTAYLVTVTTSRPLGSDDAVFVRFPDGRELPVTSAYSDFNGVHLNIPRL
ncbi:DivIVA domain [Mobiluncus mulieris]|uniref:DivIVA domain-containing protein n=1 Tax=Mobiluncus mulieris TaxID=2052 RepID=UPI00019F8ECA|nr:DivIVA domain-containing protein [Mobiluncus mulieris]EEJ54715.1 DivIVA domain protein [Mobiluncus mulieris ATCC 35243]NMX19884.1 DivIVA domain-containing protein [Mobiluncus mulieris]SPX76736.1 DivIVA domain [Mobiluncus mulieris]